MLATAEQIISTWENNPKYRDTIRYALQMPQSAKPTIKYVDGMLEQVMQRIESNRMGKGTRPWEIVDVTSTLDPEQCWIGIEFETGFDEKREYDMVMNYLWKNHNNNAVDYEGCGNYKCEITFSPVNMEDFHTSKYDMDRLLGYMNEREIDQGERNSYDAVGIHVNISTPTFRNTKLGWSRRSAIANVLSETLEQDMCDVKRFFHRSPYGYFEDRGDQYGNHWIEGKLFESTHDEDDWEEYKITINNLALLIEYMASMKSLNEDDIITNINAILAGEVDAEEAEFSSRDSDSDNGNWY